MSETQWPRFEVFVQETRSAPYLETGSVHAPDPWMALLNARDVFARRPACVSMWVVQAEVIYSRTAEQLEAESFASENLAAEGRISNKDAHTTQDSAVPAAVQSYYAACKEKPAGTLEVVGQVEAESAEEAMRKAINDYGTAFTGWVWWVFPVRAVLSSQPEDTESMYAPALEKTFRLSTDFHTVSAMRQLRKAGSDQTQPALAGEPANTTEGDACER